ncbi:uncharacterized protein C1orf87 homolog isoform X5 [Vicugna pacos]|uniref:Uncharacterized protein C1orf87 homolog isoform X5 n=1 Tax=Vicugna pacos TaxID=30538 RepID=A0ABM5EFE2_VICPA
MSSVRKSPCGSGVMPEMVVKIIGSKHFRYLAEKPKIKENKNLKAETQTMLQKSVTGIARQMSQDPPAPTNSTNHQINPDAHDVEESKRSEHNQKLLTGVLGHRFLDGKANIYCSSVPTGDQSLSYIHGLPRRNLRDWSLEQMAKSSSGQPEDIGQRPSGTTREDTFLLALVRRELKSRPLSSGLLDKLQKELKILDPISSGFLLQSQLSRLFLKLEVPLQLPTVKILCQRFSRRDSPEMVNYEKLLQFLTVTALGDPQQSKTVEDSSMKGTQGGSHRRNPDVLFMVCYSFSLEQNSVLPEVKAICGKHGLHLTLSLLETLLNHEDLGHHGEIKWQNFVELLSRASSDLSSDLPIGKKGKETSATPVHPEVPEISQCKTVRTKTPEEDLQPENPPAKTSAPPYPLSPLKMRPVSQPSVSPVMKNAPEERETWIDRFRKLENALYLCDLSNTGVLEKERARRLIHNYNLIYNLSLSPRKIDQALRRFRAGGNTLLEPALRYLKEL